MYLVLKHPDLLQTLRMRHPLARYLSYPGLGTPDAIAHFARNLAVSLTRSGTGEPDALLCFDYPSGEQSRVPMRLYLTPGGGALNREPFCKVRPYDN
jgi:hypothetical protein